MFNLRESLTIDGKLMLDLCTNTNFYLRKTI